MAGNQLFVKFWGVRGSYPVPGQNTARFGGNTSCVEVRAGNHIIILDAGTGIIELGQKLLDEIKGKSNEQAQVLNLLFSHTHHDHIQGLPYFAPAFYDNCTINLFGQKTFSQDLEEILALNMAPQYSPIELDELTSELTFTNINENHMLLFEDGSLHPELTTRNNGTPPKDATALKLMRNYAHPKVGTFIIKIEVDGKSVVYATDTEGYVGGDTRLTQFAKNANLLIHDAQYDPEQYLETQGYGHSTYEMAAEVAIAANVEQLVLFHHDPAHDDAKLSEMESRAKKIFPNTTMGAEGFEFKF